MPKRLILGILGYPKNGTSSAKNKNPKTVLESVTKSDSKTGFDFKFWAFLWIFENFGPTDYIHLYVIYSQNLGSLVLGKLEQQVKHVFAMKFVTDQESSIYKFGGGTLVISVLV